MATRSQCLPLFLVLASLCAEVGADGKSVKSSIACPVKNCGRVSSFAGQRLADCAEAVAYSSNLQAILRALGAMSQPKTKVRCHQVFAPTSS